jgi:GAF domain
VSADVVGLSGAGVMLVADQVIRGSLRSNDQVSNLIEDLQFTLGEGPCVDAYQSNEAVLVPNLADPGHRRWLAFTPSAVTAGVGAIFGFPLRVGKVRLGALDLYRDRPGALNEEQYADALVMADVAAHWVLDVQADAPLGAMPAELELGAEFHLIVHNAAGMVAAQLGTTVTDALIRLRAHAFSHELLLRDVAESVVDRTLRFS